MYTLSHFPLLPLGFHHCCQWLIPFG